MSQTPPSNQASASGNTSPIPSGSPGFPKFISEARTLEPKVPAAVGKSSPSSPQSTSPTSSPAVVGSSSSGSGGVAKGAAVSTPPPLNLCIVINLCHYLTPLAKLILLAQPLESIANEIDREAFLTLQAILKQLDSGRHEPINIFPFLDKLCQFMCTSLNDFEEMDISFVWDNVVKLITLVIPPLRELFLGRRSLSLDEHAWVSLISRCIHAQFTYPLQTLEDFIKVTLNQQDLLASPSESYIRQRTPLESIKNFNAIILSRLPDVLAFAVESGHLPPSLRFLDALSKVATKAKPPVCIKYPASFVLPNLERNEEVIYELVGVVTLEGTSFEVAQAYYRYAQDKATQWYKGSGATHDAVETSRALEKNYLHSNDSKKVHPRLLIYVKKGIHEVLASLQDFVTKAGQLRSLGDAAFENAETPEHYDDAKQYYEEAIAQDESLRAVLQEKLDALDQIERNQKAQSYENQADQSLGRKRFKEACDLYKLASRSAVPNSTIFNRIREKEDYMMRIISLEIANHLTEKGEECLKNGMYAQSRENFAQALKLNPTYIHLQSIIQGIDKKITTQTSAQKEADGYQAMKIGRYKYANQLFQEAVALVPEKEVSLKSVLESLVVLMQGEDALMKQRSGLLALEDKKYAQAVQLITEAIGLLPKETVMEHAFYLCDRAQVYFEMKDYATSMQDCYSALQIRPEFAMAYLRLGSAQFELEQYDEALQSYDKALKNDSSLADQVKVKIRQVNTAKEVQQRKEREAERARAREEEQKKLEEKRLREEKQRKERAEKLAQEQAEKAERLLMQKEEKLMMTVLNRSTPSESTKVSAKSNQPLKEKQMKEKAEKEMQRALEKERIKAEKEKEKERQRVEKEAKAREEQIAKEAEEKRQREFALEMEKAAAKLREAEREKELERERVRMENERIIAEREKARQEKTEKKQKAQAEEKGGREDGSLSNSNTASSTPSSTPAPKKNKKNLIPVPIDFPTLSKTASVVEVIKPALPVTKPLLVPMPTPPPKPTRSVTTPAASGKWASLLISEDPVPSTQSKVQQQSVKQTVYEDFPALGDKQTGLSAGMHTMSLDHSILSLSSSSLTKEPVRINPEPIPSSGELKSVLNSIAHPTPLSQMPPLASAFATSDFNVGWGESVSALGGPSLLHPSSDLLLKDPAPPGITPISPRADIIGSGLFLGLGGGGGGGTGGTGLGEGDMIFQPFQLSSPLSSHALGNDDSSNVIGSSILRPPSLSSMPSFGDNTSFSMEPLGKGFGLMSGLETTEQSENRDWERSRLSHLFSSSLGSDLLNPNSAPSSGSSLLGQDNSLNLNLSPFGLSNNSLQDNSLGFGFLDNRAPSPAASLLRAPGAFANEPSRSSFGLLGGFGLPESSSSLLGGSSLLSGLSSGFDNSLSTSSFSTFGLPSLLPNATATPARRSDLHDLRRRPEDEVLGENAFPAVSKYRQFGMVMFNYALHGSEWAEFCLLLPKVVLQLLGGDDAPILSEIAVRSGCEIKVVDVVLSNMASKGAVFVRGSIGNPSNRFMDQALEMLNSFLTPHISTIHLHSQQQHLPFSATPVQPAPAVPLMRPLVYPEVRSGILDSPSASTMTSESSLPSSAPAVSSISASLQFPPPFSLVEEKDAYVKSAGKAATQTRHERPALLKVTVQAGSVRRYLEIPADLIGLVIGAGGKKIKELSAEAGCKVQFKTSKPSDREGRPGLLELQGTPETVDRAMSLIWDLMQAVGKEYKEITAHAAKKHLEK
ncbi:hypothetical protein EON64_01160 [archaeon]|nr:MAG: hypothetical protein EON64_01160 [archaeon]